MNSYLLDTHILLWWLDNDKKLNKPLRELISNPNNIILVSSVNILEIVIKANLNKLEAPNNLREALDASNFRTLAMTIDHALYLEKLPLIHHDPFDRLLISQCVVDGLTLLTADKIIPKYKIKLIKN